MRDPNQTYQEGQVREQGAEEKKGGAVAKAVIQMWHDNPSSNLIVGVCVETIGNISMEERPVTHQTAAPVSTQNHDINNILPSQLPNRSPYPSQQAFRRYVSAPAVLRNRILVTQNQVEVSRSALTPANILSNKNFQAQKPFLVRKVRARTAFSTKSIPPVVRTGWETVDKSVTLAEVPEILAQDKAEGVEEMLQLRGGCGSWMGKKGKMRRLEDDEELPPMIWWLSGGQPRHPLPTGSKLRWWKAKSKGQWQTGQSRGYFQEFAYVLSDGRLCRNELEKESKECTEGRKNDGLTDNVAAKETTAPEPHS
ncbi:hypothetical protein MGYG_07713 [Nannizzia gypsea CBS 118893]|uniref:Uncharacterized protein n=1 Tax=Arthroderma gypseum (strain ATCC MYA-4604 / CBS 118893) TaxID=535722 RepID=E4V3Y1_ARTGP|nr:hypothetical protein MGYG_07713 [Nannizzia gypsea CBS 118893]EFR04705.1 hypothetical protein MGYG_07713 [Nannizzia gypsea CBS 118893]